MSDGVVMRGPEEGRTLLVGGSDFITYKVRSEETQGAYFCFEMSATPGFGPPLHRHAYRELFFVLEGAFEFTLAQDGAVRKLTGQAGTALAVEPNVPHTFRNVGDAHARLLMVHQPAALEDFFEEFGVPVAGPGQVPEGLQPPDPAEMAAALRRNGVEVLDDAEAVLS
jgi:quercetin dioxygenase-like cupin family protein